MGPSMATRTYYDAKAHGLRYDPLKAIVAPRPIGWISTYGEDGSTNLAPYSFFNLVSDSPKIVMFSSVGWKDTATNAKARGAFAANLATQRMIEAMNESSAAFESGRSEFEEVGLTPAKCRDVDAPMIADADAVLECVVTEIIIPRTVEGTDSSAVMVLAQVVSYHIADRLMIDGRFSSAEARLLSRLGYFDYATVDETFELRRPDQVTPRARS